ncbi:MAG TPA: TolC family protein [Bacteroidales bacterium]|nr:TolC family protein [Bacteroidales bacterium]
MRTKIFSGRLIVIAGILTSVNAAMPAQEVKSLTLETAVELALQNNHLLNIRKLQVEEKQQKINEDRVKYFPVIGLGGSYQYNTRLPELVIEQGRFGGLPLGGTIIPLPAIDERFDLGQHNVYNAGVTFYQPVTQLGRINAGVNYSKTEMHIAETEELRAVMQVKQVVEKLFFGLLITGKQIEEAELKLSLAVTKLHDGESALAAGKITESGTIGLSAAAADEEQNLLRLRMQYDDYVSDLVQLTGLNPGERLLPEPVAHEDFQESIAAIDTSLSRASEGNNDLRIAMLNKTRADYSIRASRYSYLPDVGILGGYTYQEGTDIYPKNNAYIGASLKWNLNDAFANRMIQRQRMYLKQQAEENLLNTKEQVNRDIAKAYRRLIQSGGLIKVAVKAVEYRKADLKIVSDRRKSGLNMESDLLAAKAAMAKAEADLFAAQLNYRIALSELKILTGTYK